MVFFFKQKTAYERRISDWSSDVCSSDLGKDRVNQSCGAINLCGNRNNIEAWLHPVLSGAADIGKRRKIGRASCRERVCQYVSISVVAVSLKKTKKCASICTIHVYKNIHNQR